MRDESDLRKLPPSFGRTRKRIVLAGCGHAHLEVVRRAYRLRAAGADVTLVDPGRFWYSGFGSAVLGGRCAEAEATVDPALLAEAFGVAFLADAIAGLEAGAREVTLRSGRRLGYDLLSLNIGSHGSVPAGFEGAQGAKPIADLVAFREHVVSSGGGRVVVLGGGATGCELAGNLLHLGAARGLSLQVVLATESDSLVPSAPWGLRARALQSLTRRGADVRMGAPVEGREAGAITLTSGERIAFDHLLLAAGLVADPLMQRLGLPAGPAGLRVSTTLVSIGDPHVFAAGDCAAIEGFDLPKIGVHGVRAGPVLLRNLLAALDGRPLEDFQPQTLALQILDLADGEGLAMRGGYWMGGRLALLAKNHLDRRFLDGYRRRYGSRVEPHRPGRSAP